MSLSFHEYTAGAQTTNKHTDLKDVLIGLEGEMGEMFSKIYKIIRDQNGIMSAADEKLIMGEMGDALWFMAISCNLMGFELEECAISNLDKLARRKQQGMLYGSGDTRGLAEKLRVRVTLHWNDGLSTDGTYDAQIIYVENEENRIYCECGRYRTIEEAEDSVYKELAKLIK